MSSAVVRDRAELHKIIEIWKSAGLKVGFVPTMGALHEGHISLVKLALEKADKCVVSIFINPVQFAPYEDFASYPRSEKEDIERLEKAGVNLVYLPSETIIYPGGYKTRIKAGKAAQGLENDYRPGFFDGVVNVVERLFDHVEPDIAVFGEKDYQQLCVIREMIKTFGLSVEITGAPIIRDSEGLALSSRNAYLSENELRIARRLNKILFALADNIKKSPDQVDGLIATAMQSLIKAGFDKVDYLELLKSGSSEISSRLLAAIWLGKTRLIDNVRV